MSPEEFDKELIAANQYLLRFAKKLCFDSSRAHDLVQETYLRAFKHRETYNESNTANIKSWLTTIMKNYFLDTYRRTKIRGKNIEILPIHDFYQNDLSLGYNLAESKINAMVIVEQIKKLKGKQKRAFLYFYAGYSLKEISVKEKMTVNSVKSYLFRARKTLQDKFNKVYNQ